MKLSSIKVGKKVKIKRLTLSKSDASRINAIGIKIGDVLQVENYSLLGGSILVKRGNIRVMMRKNIAKKIEVEDV